MTIDDIKKLIESESTSKSPDAASMFGMILRLYEENRIVNTSVESDGDMLLFQWGTYDWGSGRYFNVDLTRQVMDDLEDPDEQADSMQQLSVALKFIPNAETEILKSGDRWCHSPDELAEFKKFVENSEAFAWAQGKIPDLVDVLLTYV
jgi:hypothetical protein